MEREDLILLDCDSSCDTERLSARAFAGTHQHSLLIRLPEEQYETFLALPGAAPFEPMPGRPMRGFAVFPEAMLAQPERLRQWVQTAFESAAALPLKAPKAPSARARPKKTA
ncbi:MAG: hypothetical protein ACYDCQ_09825 [Dehalococcoidia bacterium]